MNLGEVNLVKNSGKIAKSSTESVIGMTFLQNLVISGSSNILWSCLSELQIIEHFNLLYFKIPANWATFAENIDSMTNLEIVDSE